MRRSCSEQTLLIVCSLLDVPQQLSLQEFDLLPGTYFDRLHQTPIKLEDELELAPYQVRWLQLDPPLRP